MIREFALAILIVSCTFLRRRAASVIRFLGVNALIDDNAAIQDKLSGDRAYIRLRASDTKNTRARAFSYRYFSDTDATGLPWRSWFLDLATGKAPGPLLANEKNEPFNSNTWGECFKYFVGWIHENVDDSIERASIGATSGRRWFAQTLYSQGNLRKDQLCALGFWMSDACDIYLDEDADGRLDLLRGFADQRPLARQSPITEDQAEQLRRSVVESPPKRRRSRNTGDVPTSGSLALTLFFQPAPPRAPEAPEAAERVELL